MHRSGTSLVSRILDRSGVFMGLDLQEDHESKFFIKLNKWIYENAGADWARPMALQELMDYEPAKKKVEEYVKSRVSSNSSKKYSGKSLKKGLFDLDSKWGWKDPRNGPTLPIWKEIWPEMKIIHVTRHGVDVAASLQARSSKNWEQDESRFSKWVKMYRWKDSKSPIRRGQRAATLSHALDFWSEQMEVENKNLEGCEFVLEVRYEDLLTKPKSAIKQIWNFIDIERDDSLLEDISQSIDGSRAYAYKKDEEMMAFALENSEILEIFGYLP
tara:strand:- start:1015 stop:1830 length:816 start_codon:yes stop_codon:yes gene_type:complete